ncbi:hypothetical protein INP91_07205 [Haemophilus parainfluenzae]|uniref:hypothetical protein n=1 Tax=Haemophilus parainfluenzae TaxID=729 RepID=UPI0018A591B6|nr:hypothetical protein [Haemophilus parainfluenzae]MBS5162653.1 hypothetical protein [Haemophilus parainfluenzae]QOR22443.1 hypothetical protein INP91_07205 [Haemophilus parainfluenzae]
MKKAKIKANPLVERISNAVNTPARKIVQIAMSNNLNGNSYMETMIALCDDGTLWQRGVRFSDERFEGGEWFRLNDVPQD